MTGEGRESGRNIQYWLAAGRAVLRHALAGNLTLLLLTALVIGAGYLAGALVRQHDLMRDVLYWPSIRYFLFFLWLPLPFAFLVGRLRVRDATGEYVRGWRGWKGAWTLFRERYANPAGLARAAVAGLAASLIVNVYGSWKRAMPSVWPFVWDEPLARLDRVLHLGTDPWQLVHPWLARPMVTYGLDALYYTWLPLFMAVLAWQAWSGSRDLRRRFFVSAVFVWIGLGNVAATLLSSAGPAFYGFLVGGPDPFAPLFAYLAGVGGPDTLLTLRGQEVLWTLHTAGEANPYSGISAMPSVHIGMTTLYTLMGWERARWLGIGFGLYGLAMLIATVHLGWHYAVDGYVSILAVWLFWRLLRRGDPGLARFEARLAG